MKQFIWQPTLGIDSKSLERMRVHFKRPTTPMGEAWFMGEKRRIFDELMGDLNPLSASQLQAPLNEIASGTSSFEPLKEWRDWYHYLLAQLVTRGHECCFSSILESLLTGFMALYPNGVYNPPYRGFLNDALQTLGRCMMESQCWTGSDVVVGTCLHRANDNPNHLWRWWDASGDFSASMFFCLKYLPESCLREWIYSVLHIASPHWRAQVLVWLVGAQDMLSGRIHWPSEFPEHAYPSVRWEGSHCLRPELTRSDESGAPPVTSLVSKASCALVLRLTRLYFTEEVFIEWLESIAKVPYLESELGDIPTTFENLYVCE